MRIFVTGGAGFVGANFIRTALGQGHEVLNYDALTPSASLSATWDLEEFGTYRLVLGDVSDHGDLKKAIFDYHPDGIVHLAGVSGDAGIEYSSADIFNANILGTFNILEIAEKYRETCRAGADFPILIPTDPMQNDAPNLFAASKSAADILACHWQTHAADRTVRFVAAPIYGPGMGDDTIIKITCDLAFGFEPIPVVQSAMLARRWLYIDDLSDVLLDLVEHPTSEKLVVISGSEMIRPMQLAREICRAADVLIPSGGDHKSLISPILGDDSVKTSQLLPTHLGLTPFTQGIAQTVRWAHRMYKSQISATGHDRRMGRTGAAA